MFLNNKGGFTLIELLVVVSIVGMLSSVVLSSLSGARERARDTKRLSDMRQIQVALELYHSSQGQYPNVGASSARSNIASWSTLEGLLSSHITPLPVDPINVGDPSWFVYYYDSDTGDGNQSYGLMAQMESSSNYDIAANDGGNWNASPWYYVELGDQPAYCQNKGEDWSAGSVTTVCQNSN